jgi:hypothetical protein
MLSAETLRANPPDGSAGTAAPDADNGGAKQHDPLRKLVDQLAGLQTTIAAADPRLGKEIQLLAQDTDPEGKGNQNRLRTRIAYALQDAERIVGPIAGVPQGLRDQMTLLATTMPALQNERLQALLRNTPNIADGNLVRAIRINAATISREQSQHSVEIERRIDTLAQRVSQAPQLRTDEAVRSALTTAQNVKTERQVPQDQYTPQLSPSPGQRQQPQQIVVAREATGPSALLSIFRGFRDPAATTHEPWDPTPSPLGPRIAASEAKIKGRREEGTLAAAERSGRAALDALQQFANGPGASVMNRIRETARSDPGGLPAVMAGMREGGKYADLRTQFNNALGTEKGLGAVYDRAALALSQYGANRTAADAVISHRPDAAALNARFETLDGEIGQAASSIPGRKDGTSALDELAEKAREIVTKAIGTVRSMFGRGPSADATATHTASPSAAPVA